MRGVTLLVFVFAFTMSFGQSKKDAAGTDKPANPAAAQPDAGWQQALTDHYMKKYTLALRWNDDVAAKSALYDLIVENPQSDSLIFSLAYFYYQNQQYAPAMLVSQELLSRDPKNEVYLELSGNSFEEIGIFDRALQNYETLYLLTNNIETLYKISFLQYNLKRYTEGLTNVDILLSKPAADTIKVVYNDAQNKPKEYAMRVAVLNLKGLIKQQLGDAEEATKLYVEALKLAPDFLPAQQNIANLKKK